MTSSSFDQANEADVAEQQREVVEDDSPRTPPSVPPDQADEADVLEQADEVGEDEEY